MALTHSQIGKKGPLCTLEVVVKKEQIKLTKTKAEKKLKLVLFEKHSLAQ